jgi:hypothetical protein
VLGIVGLVICPVVGSILALLFGIQARGRIRASGGVLSGESQATAGIVLGSIGLAITALAILAIIAILIFGHSTSFVTPGTVTRGFQIAACPVARTSPRTTANGSSGRWRP